MEIRESQRRAGRPERPLDPGNDGPLSAFASSLRELRRAAGNPSYRKLAERALFVPSVLSTAANGSALPSLQVTLAFVGACGGDVVEWRQRWEAVASTLAAPAAGLRGPGPARRAAASPAQLPAVCPHFVGREAECASLLGLTDPVNPSRTGSVTISGPIGVGKSAFAVHFAHRATRIYPDGQLYADLAGCRAAGQSAHELLGRFLSALGVPPEQIPDEPQQRTGLYRTMLAGRRVLVLLDDAVTESEVRPLLATGTSCLVVITSRRRLAGLDNARRVTLDVLGPDESMALLTGVIGESRIAADADAARMVNELCGQLPIAVWIAATRLLDHPGRTARYAMERLRDPANGLDWLMAGDVSLRHRLWSAYDQLGPSSRRAFRRLGAAAGTSGGEIHIPDMATILGVPPRDAESLLETLVEAGVLQVCARTAGYRIPALFAAAARELLRKREPATAARWLRSRILAAPAA